MDNDRKEIRQQGDQYRNYVPKKKNTPLFYILLFPSLAAFLVIFLLINVLSKPRTFSPQENRNLAQKPELTLSSVLDGSYTSMLTSYMEDQFVGRDYWIRLRNNTRKAIGFKENDGIYFGNEGYLLKQGEPVDEANLALTVQAVSDFSARHSDLKMTFLLVPGSQTVLSDKLPSGVSEEEAFLDRNKALEVTESKLKNLQGLTYVNAKDALKGAASSGQLYYKTDHHWTTYGAFVAFSSIKTTMGIDIETPNYDVLTVSESFQGTLASQSGSFDETDKILIYRPIATETLPEVNYYVLFPDEKVKLTTCYRTEKLAEKDQYTVFFGGNYGRLEIHTTNLNERRLLIFKDSYANCFIPFLIQYYEQIDIVDPRYYYDNADQLIQNDKITDVLFLYSENTFFNDKSLKDVLAG